MKERSRKRRAIVLVVFLLILAFLISLLMRCRGERDDLVEIGSTEEREKSDSSLRPVRFVELIYEQSFSPLPEKFSAPPEPGWPSPMGYFFQPLSGRLYSSDGRQEPLDGEAMVGKRLRFYEKLWAHSPGQFGELIVADEMNVVWKINEQPGVEAMSGFDGFSHLRLPLEIKLVFDGQSVFVSGGDKAIEFKGGETHVVAAGQKEYTLDELARFLNDRLNVPQDGQRVTAEILLKHSRLLGLESGERNGKVTLYGRVAVVCHESVIFGERDLLVMMQEGEKALLCGDIETALVRYQSMTNILPENRMIADQLAMAMNPPELIRNGVRLAGAIRYSGDPPAQVSIPPFVRATGLDDSGRDEVAYLESTESYSIFLLPGKYRIEVQQLGFQSEVFEIEMKKGEPAERAIVLTEIP